MAGPEKVSELLSRLQSPDFRDREKAVKELVTINTDDAVAGLILAMEDPDLGIRESAAERLVELKSSLASQLLIRFLAHDDVGTRDFASEVLVRIGSPAVTTLTDNLTSDDPDIRRFICDILGLIGDKAASEVLGERLKDANINVVCSACEALGAFAGIEAIEPLKVVSGTIDDARLPAIEAIGRIGEHAGLDHLYGYLDLDDPITLSVAIEAIGHIGHAEAIPRLIEHLDSEHNCVVESTMMAIINIDRHNGGKVTLDISLESFTDFLLAGIRGRHEAITDFALSHFDQWQDGSVLTQLLEAIDYVDEVRLGQITEALAERGSPVVPVILAKLSPAAKGLKLKLLDVLKQFVDEGIGPEILPLMNDGDPEVRQKAAYILGICGHRGAVSDLKLAAVDINGHVRAAALAALGWLCAERDIGFIRQGLDDRYPDVRNAALGALILIGGSTVVASFCDDLYHENSKRQRLAVAALGWIGDRQVISPLLQAISHPDSLIRKSALNALTRIGEIHELDPIVLALTDESAAVRKAAISALAVLKGEAAIADIRPLLDDADIWVRYQAISAIGELADQNSGELITPYLDDDSDIIKIAVAKALARIGTPEALPALGRLFADSNNDLADAAKKAISNIGSSE